MVGVGLAPSSCCDSVAVCCACFVCCLACCRILLSPICVAHVVPSQIALAVFDTKAHTAHSTPSDASLLVYATWIRNVVYGQRMYVVRMWWCVLIIYAMRDSAPADTQKSASRKAMRRGRFDAAGRMFKTTLKARFLGFLASCIVDHAFALYDFIQDTRKSSGAICDGPHAGLTPLQKLSRRSNGQILNLVAYSVAGATGAVIGTLISPGVGTTWTVMIADLAVPPVVGFLSRR